MELELANYETSVDTVTVLQGALMKERSKRPATAQEKLLLHNIYKAGVRLIESITDEEKRKVLEAAMDILNDRLKDFRDGDKLVRVKQQTEKGTPTEWDIEAVAWCNKAFKMIQEVYPLLKEVKEFHTLLGALNMAATKESRDMIAPQTALEVKGNRKRRHNKDGDATATGPAKKPRVKPPNKNTDRKTKKAERTESERDEKGDKLQKLFMDFKSLTQCQVKGMRDEKALEVHSKIKDDDLDWSTAIEDDGSNNVKSVCERHEK